MRHLLHKPIEIAPWPAGIDRRSRLVFITQGGIARENVQGLFAAVDALVT